MEITLIVSCKWNLFLFHLPQVVTCSEAHAVISLLVDIAFHLLFPCLCVTITSHCYYILFKVHCVVR